MANQLSKLIKKADALAETAAQLVARSVREVRGELAILAKESNIATSAADREAVYKMIKKRMERLSLRLDRLLEVQHLLAAKTAASAASDMTGIEIKFSKRHAQAVLELVSPAQGANLAAVFTDKMSQNLITTLREAVVATLREQAVMGGSMSEAAASMQKRWDNALKNTETPRFTDSAGRVWDTKNYFMMNARTSSMRIYNDCLADDVARETGSDLMRISRHGSDPHCACAAWEGQIISLSGKTKGFPTYEDARRGGCFHPNCVHTLEVVDEVADADEIALQSSHPVNPDLATDPDEQDERKYAIDQERKMKEEGLTQEKARLAVDRDNLTAAIRTGLIREDASDLVKSLTDAQVTALCPNGNPPRFAPVKRVRGGTRQQPKYEPEKWRKGSQGGVIHITRDTTAQHLAKVANVENAKATIPTTPKPTTPTPAPTPEPTKSIAQPTPEEQERAEAVNAVLALLPDEKQREFHTHSFDLCPDNVLKKIKESVKAITYSTRGDMAYCVGRTVCLSENMRGWSNTPSTIRHECGHAVFNNILRDLYYLSKEELRQKFDPIISAAKTDMTNWIRKIYGKRWQSFTDQFQGGWYKEIGTNTFGFSPNLFDNEEVCEETKVSGAVSDIFCSALKGFYFDGHSIDYYLQDEIVAHHEIIAEITSLSGSRYAKKAREILPNTFAKVEELIYETKG